MMKNSESAYLIIYCALIFLLALTSTYLFLLFLPISFFFLPTLCTQKNQHYNVRLNPKFIPRHSATRGPPPLLFL